jgi:phage shock protein E
MNCDKISELLKNGSLIVDVREPEEYDRGRIIGSINIPMYHIPYTLDQMRDKQVYVYCRSGNRSEAVKQYLLTEGIDVHNIGGINNFMGCLQF